MQARPPASWFGSTRACCISSLLQFRSALRPQSFPHSSVSPGSTHRRPSRPRLRISVLPLSSSTPPSVPVSAQQPLEAFKVGSQCIHIFSQLLPLLPTLFCPQASHARPACPCAQPFCWPRPLAYLPFSAQSPGRPAPLLDPPPTGWSPLCPAPLQAPPTAGRNPLCPAPPSNLAGVPAVALRAHHSLSDGAVVVCSQVTGGAVEHRQE